MLGRPADRGATIAGRSTIDAAAPASASAADEADAARPRRSRADACGAGRGGRGRRAVPGAGRRPASPARSATRDEGINAAVWSNNSRAAPRRSVRSSRGWAAVRLDDTDYATHPPLIVVETAVSRGVARRARAGPRAGRRPGSPRSSPWSCSTGCCGRPASSRWRRPAPSSSSRSPRWLLVYGSMLDTPVTSLPRSASPWPLRLATGVARPPGTVSPWWPVWRGCRRARRLAGDASLTVRLALVRREPCAPPGPASRGPRSASRSSAAALGIAALPVVVVVGLRRLRTRCLDKFRWPIRQPTGHRPGRHGLVPACRGCSTCSACRSSGWSAAWSPCATGAPGRSPPWPCRGRRRTR